VASAVASAEAKAGAEAAAAAAAVAELEALRRAQEEQRGELFEGGFDPIEGGGELSTARYRSERDKLLARLRNAYQRCAGMAGDKEETLNMLIQAEEEKVALQQGLVQYQVWGDTLAGQLAAAGLAAAAVPGTEEATVAFHTQGGARRVAILSSAAVQDEVARMRMQLGTLQEALTRTKRELHAERLRRAGSVAELEGVLGRGGLQLYLTRAATASHKREMRLNSPALTIIDVEQCTAQSLDSACVCGTMTSVGVALFQHSVHLLHAPENAPPS
jgi:hypothetical protein